MLDNVGKNNELRDAADGCMTEAEKKILGITPDLEPERLFRASVARVMQEDAATINVQHVPLNKARSVDRKDIYPYQGKESDGEIMFSFESLVDAQDLYDFMLETQLVTPGEIKLKVHESGAHAQYSVHFTANVLVQKPDVIQAAMIAYQDQLAEGDEEAFEDLAQDVDMVLTERAEIVKSKRGSAEPSSTGRGQIKAGVDFNPFHDKRGIFTSREGLSDGGSWSDGKKRRLKATKKGAKLHFAGTKRPCGREARGKGKDIRCWDGQPGLGFEVAKAMKKMAKAKRDDKREMPNYKKEDFDRTGMAAIQECWDLYGIPLNFENLDETLGSGHCPPGQKMVFGKCAKPASRVAGHQFSPAAVRDIGQRKAHDAGKKQAYLAAMKKRQAAKQAESVEGGMSQILDGMEEGTDRPLSGEGLDEGGRKRGAKKHGPSMDSLKNRYTKQREGIKAYRAGSQRVAARAAAKTESMAALLGEIEEASERMAVPFSSEYRTAIAFLERLEKNRSSGKAMSQARADVERLRREHEVKEKAARTKSAVE